MLNDIQNQIDALGAYFRLPLEALTAIQAQHGSAPMLEHARAHPDDDEATRLVAVMLTNATFEPDAELVRAQASAKTHKIAKVRRPLDRVLAAAQARAQARRGD